MVAHFHCVKNVFPPCCPSSHTHTHYKHSHLAHNTPSPPLPPPPPLMSPPRVLLRVVSLCCSVVATVWPSSAAGGVPSARAASNWGSQGQVGVWGPKGGGVCGNGGRRGKACIGDWGRDRWGQVLEGPLVVRCDTDSGEWVSSACVCCFWGGGVKRERWRQAIEGKRGHGRRYALWLCTCMQHQ